MKISRCSTWLWLTLLLLVLLSPLVLRSMAQSTPGSNSNAEVKTVGGLTTVVFNTDSGKIVVHLPDDIAAGDTISGTVVTEPKGKTPEERAKNQDELNGYVLDLEGTRVPTKPPAFSWLPPTPPATTPPRYSLRIVEVLPNRIIAGAVITPYPSAPPPSVVFQLPTIGQQGRPLEIVGPFDGNISNTKLNWTAVSSVTQDFEKSTENVSGGFGLIGRPLAESPRKCIFESPRTVTGPVQIILKEGNVETKAEYRNVGVQLSAPKTSLVKGERTTLTIKVEGLQGIKQDVPLQLVKVGVVSMEGGDLQTTQIKPADVHPDGSFTMTRAITGQESGAFNVTATVVMLNACLQDDKSGNSLIFSSETGDYIFCQPGSNVTGTGTVTRKGCTLALQHDAPNRKVQARSDKCTQNGNATVQFGPGTALTITDKDTRNNTCVCGGGK